MTDDDAQPLRLVWVDLAEETRNLPPTDNETTPEYRAWVDANRTAVEARQDLVDFDGENFMGKNICSL